MPEFVHVQARNQKNASVQMLLSTTCTNKNPGMRFESDSYTNRCRSSYWLAQASMAIRHQEGLADQLHDKATEMYHKGVPDAGELHNLAGQSTTNKGL